MSSTRIVGGRVRRHPALTACLDDGCPCQNRSKLVRVLTAEVPGGYELTIEADDARVLRLIATAHQVEAPARQFTKLVEDDEQAGG